MIEPKQIADPHDLWPDPHGDVPDDLEDPVAVAAAVSTALALPLPIVGGPKLSQEQMEHIWGHRDQDKE